MYGGGIGVTHGPDSEPFDDKSSKNILDQNPDEGIGLCGCLSYLTIIIFFVFCVVLIK